MLVTGYRRTGGWYSIRGRRPDRAARRWRTRARQVPPSRINSRPHGRSNNESQDTLRLVVVCLSKQKRNCYRKGDQNHRIVSTPPPKRALCSTQRRKPMSLFSNIRRFNISGRNTRQICVSLTWHFCKRFHQESESIVQESSEIRIFCHGKAANR